MRLFPKYVVTNDKEIYTAHIEYHDWIFPKKERVGIAQNITNIYDVVERYHDINFPGTTFKISFELV